MDLGQHAEPRSSGMVRSIVRNVATVVFVFVLAWALRTFVFQPYKIPSGSMEDTIMTGDFLVSEKVSYYFREPQQGDIVTFYDPAFSGDVRTLIKRVVATEGQTVDLVDGVVYVDGKPLSEPYTDAKPSYPLENSSISFPYTVPEGSLWVMGDNRTNSQDSRWFGAVSKERVTGRAVVIFWPIPDIRSLA